MKIGLKAKAIHCYRDLQLVRAEYQAKGLRMVSYLEKFKTPLRQFDYYSVEQIQQKDNTMADTLARLATSRKAEELNVVPIETFPQLSISEPENVSCLEDGTTWMSPILAYLKSGCQATEMRLEDSCTGYYDTSCSTTLFIEEASKCHSSGVELSSNAA